MSGSEGYMTEKEIGLVLAFLEECQEHGADYAQERLWQRWKFTKYRVKDVNKAVEEVEKQIERKYKTERKGYLAVITLGAIACLVNLAVVTNPRLPDSLRLVFCFIMPAAIVLVRSYWRHLKEVGQRRSQTRKDLEALHSAFGGLLQA